MQPKEVSAPESNNSEEEIKKTSNKNGFYLKILGILVFIAALSFGAYYLGTLKNSSKSQNQNITSKTTTVPSVSIDPTANPDSIGASWKTYSNQTHNYSFKYPSDLSVDETLNNMDPKPDIVLTFPKNQKPSYYFFNISITVIDVSENLSLQEAIDQVASKYYSVKGIKFQSVKIAGLNAFASEFPEAYYGYITFLLKDNKLFAFQLSGNPGSNQPVEERKVFDQILSTFKFQ